MCLTFLFWTRIVSGPSTLLGPLLGHSGLYVEIIEVLVANAFCRFLRAALAEGE